jgi:hypothetical protein
LSSLVIASKDRHLRRQEHKTQPKGPTKQRETAAKAEIGAKTKNRGNISSTISSTKKRRGLKFKAEAPETKEFNLGHSKQVFLSTEGSSTSIKFKFLFCVEEQQQGGGDCQICWQ